MKAVIRTLPLCAFALAVSACGDPDTNDARGYTKAPLEHPTILIEGEEPTEMAMLRDPLTPPIREVPLPEREDTAAEQQQPTDQQAAPVQLPEGVTQEMVAAGQQVYGSTGFCFTCHAADGAGTPLAPALNDSEWLHIDGSYEAIMTIVREGVPQPQQFPAAMPPMGGAQLTDEQIRDVAAYVYSISR